MTVGNRMQYSTNMTGLRSDCLPTQVYISIMLIELSNFSFVSECPISLYCNRLTYFVCSNTCPTQTCLPSNIFKSSLIKYVKAYFNMFNQRYRVRDSVFLRSLLINMRQFVRVFIKYIHMF